MKLFFKDKTSWVSKVCFFALVLCISFLASIVMATPSKAVAKEQLISVGDVQKSILSNTDLPQRIQIYRIYNPNTGEHFYTRSEEEKDADVAAGWEDEGIGWWISPYVSENPVYRVYNPYMGDHHYTPSSYEKDYLVSVGWLDEGICWYEATEIDRIPVYRTYNSYEFAWNHFYTKSEGEYKRLVEVGWNDEGTAWYAYDKMQTDISDADVTFTDQLIYNGEEQTQPVEVKLGSRVLREGIDYTIEGATNKDAGTYTVTITGNNEAAYVGTIKRTYTIEKKSVKVTRITVNERQYDQTTEATVDEVVLDGVCDGDDVDLSVNAAFEDSAVGNDKTVVVSDATLIGDDISNYKLDETMPEVKGNITPKQLKLKGLTFEDKNYDRTDTATPTPGSAVLEAGFSGEDVSLDDITARFEDWNAGVDKTIIVGEFKLIGNDAGNYVVVPEEGATYTATIYQKKIAIKELSFKERVYEEGNKNAEVDTSSNKFSDGAICEGDEVVVAEATYSYADDNAGNNKQVVLMNAPVLAGRDKNNYEVTSYPPTIAGTVLAIIRYNTNCETQKAEEYVKVDSLLTRDETGLERTGLKIENWYTDAKCTDDEEHRWDYATDTVTQNIITLNANWTPDSDLTRYWISPSMNISSGTGEKAETVSNDNYVKEAWNVEKSYAEIKKDLNVLKNKSQYSTEEYNAVKNEYESFLKNDDYHLYTQFTGNTNTYGDVEDTTVTKQNGYVEARIIQVGEHDGDGTGLTFQSTHLLPQAVSMNDTNSNVGGWNGCSPYRIMNGENINYTYTIYDELNDVWDDNGASAYDGINNLFNAAFVSDLMNITKKYNPGNQTNRETVNTDVKNKMWSLSYTEVDSGHVDEGLIYWPAAGVEGSTYQWFSEHSVDLTKGNAILSFKTRNGQVPRNYFYNSETPSMFWWLRSPRTDTSTQFLYSNFGGHRGAFGNANNAMGIAPAFAM